MPKPCSICTHPQVREISRDLLAGVTYKSIAETYHVLPASLTWHRQRHVSAGLQRLAKAERSLLQDAERTEPVLLQMRKLHDRCLRILKEAEDTKNVAVLRWAFRECRENLQLLAKLSGELTPVPAVEDSRIQINIIRVEATPLSKSGGQVVQALPAPADKPN